MSEPIDRRVHFNVPMDTDDESQSSHVSDTPKSFNFGFGNSPSCQNRDPSAARPAVSQPTFNFGFNMNTQVEPAQPALAPKSLNFGWMQPAASPDRTAPATTLFNFGMGAPVTLPSTASTPPPPQPKPINFGWDCLPPPASPMQASSMASTPTTPRPQSINFGWDCLPPPASPMQVPPTTATVDPPTPPLTQLNFGWTRKASSKEAPQHVGYDMTNKPFQFGCEGEPAKVGGWKPVPFTATVSADSPATHSSLLVSYAAPALPNMVGALQLPKAPIPAIAVAAASESQALKLATLVSEAEQAAINIVKRLRSDEFDALAQSLIGTVVGPKIEVLNPTNEEVLDSNRVLLTAYSRQEIG
ncbi:hypothetical protein DFJ58DRAFT_728863 [Suillus subalutaceus]|uniref:uncharacterized protein n=1 Tax=Suillus subalutaceus TaxID=48586 RepID=UPI001B8841CD|nr:uncharacterized protein DFJ58DRAFT_728863 [Suillus subalutaceus]KAG1851424.1 hypothetical protein DFJ58DRAFT_728863 [Suillus subalutaceus]